MIGTLRLIPYANSVKKDVNHLLVHCSFVKVIRDKVFGFLDCGIMFVDAATITTTIVAVVAAAAPPPPNTITNFCLQVLRIFFPSV